ncbi:hypothetical protein ACYQR9_04000 [Methylobacterium sp. CM6241]
MQRISIVVLAISLMGHNAASAQSLEETALTLHRSGAASTVKREAPGVVVVADLNWEVRVTNEASCTVRITDRNRPAFKSISGEWDNKPATPSPNTDGLYQELYLGRVVAENIKKVPQVLGTRNGIVVDQMTDAKWRLPGSPGDEIWCIFWPDGRKSCSDNVEFERLSIVRGLPDQDERTARVDRALVHLYANLCKGSQKQIPF